MTLVPTSRGSFYVDGIFDDSDTRYIKGANVYFVDSDTGLGTQMDSISCVVTDSEGTTQYTLTTVSTPAIEVEVPAYAYVIDEIDVDGFPDGYITLAWTGTLDGYDYTHSQSVTLGEAPAMVFMTGATDTLEDFNVVLGQEKTYTVRVVDSLNNPTDGVAVRASFWDTDSGARVENVTATKKSTGLYYITKTIDTDLYSPDLDRYEIDWEIQLTDSGSWFTIYHARHKLYVYNSTTDVQAGPLTYSTNESIRKTFPGIDRLLEALVPNQGEREILLNQKRHEASTLIYPFIKNARVRKNRNLIEIWEAYEAYRLIILDAHSFAKFAVGDGQLELLDKQIKRIKQTLFSPVSTVRIGGRLT
jgi:hypothetical protein